MYAKPAVPVAASGALAATGVYLGSTVVIAVVAIIVGAVLVRLVYFRRGRKPQA